MYLFKGGTNKSQFVINSLAAELVRIQRFHLFEIAYLTVGHTKSAVDQLFAVLSLHIQKEDYFNIMYVAHTLLVTNPS